MTSYTLSPVWGAGAQLFDNSGNVLTGGKIYTYAAGTTTPVATYTTPIGNVFNSNPIIADASGRLSNEIWLPVSGAYKFVLKDTNDVLIATYDNIPTIPQPPIVNDASSISYEQGYLVTAGAFTVGATYLITNVGTTDFVAIGAVANMVGLLFTATGAGSGTGTAKYSRTVQSKLQEAVSALDFGAAANGITNDTVSIQAALSYLPSGQWLDGLGKTYLITGNITSSSDDVRLRNFNFVFGITYGTDGTFSFTGDVVHLENINVDGGRGTYKTGLEPWHLQKVFGGYNSICPTASNSSGALYFVDHSPGTSQNAKFFVKDCTFINMFTYCILYSRMYGEAFVENCVFKNYAMQDVAVWHTQDSGTTTIGHSYYSRIYCQDQASLPAVFTVDGVSKDFATSGCAVQDAYGLVIAYGDAHYSDITCINYGSCAITAETCTAVKINNVQVTALSDRQYSNNPSGAVWLENCQYSEISNVAISIQARDSRDYTGPSGDSSALFLLASTIENSIFNVSNVEIKLHPSNTTVSKGIRIIGRGPAINYNFANINVSGEVANTISAVKANGTVVQGTLNVTNFDTENSTGQALTYGFENVTFTNCNLGKDFRAVAAATFSITGSASTLTLQNVVSADVIYIYEDFVTSTTFNNVQMDVTKILLFPTSGTGSYFLTDSTLSNATITTTKNVLIKGCVISGTTIATANNANLVGNKSSFTIQIKDVQTFEIIGNDARISSAASAIYVNPVTTANILAGVISSNNVLIKTGTAGAGYVTIIAGVTDVTDVNNNKLTVAYT